jgi:Uma2 family endonuclease
MTMVAAVFEIPEPLPRSVVLTPPLSDVEFENLSKSCAFASLERSKEGAIIVNAPAGHSTGDGNSEINHQLRTWWKAHRRGRVSDSSVGFFLPDGSSLCPDAAYLTPDQIQGLTREERARFLHITPAFVIELRSPSDRLSAARKKMEGWIANGIQLGWRVDPYARQVHVYAPGAEPRIETGNSVGGSGPVDGFILDLEEVWSCFE